MAFNEVISKPFTVLPDGRRVLQCHSRGDRRYSPFFCYVDAFGEIKSIEDHYQRAKIFDGEMHPAGWRSAKHLKDEGLKQIAWQIGALRLPCRTNQRQTSFTLEDFGVQFYITLWHKYLRSNVHLLKHAAKFDEFEDPFRGDFPFCQADVFRKAVRERLDSLFPMTKELRSLLRR